jgi:hypothetical protein
MKLGASKKLKSVVTVASMPPARQETEAQSDEEPEGVAETPAGGGRRFRLRHNMIVEGKHYPRGSVVAEELIPEKFRRDDLVSLVGGDVASGCELHGRTS